MSEVFVAPKVGPDGVWDVAIIGSGPSALTAAIYTTRGAASTILFAGETWGGQLMLTTSVDNFPGFPDGVLGPELMEKMKAQAVRFGAEWVEQNVEKVTPGMPLQLVSNGKTYKAKSIIVATGAETKWLSVPGEDTFRGRGVSSCAPCDAPFFKDKKVAVVGGGDSAMEEALTIAKYALEVFIIHRRDAFRASAAMQQKVLSHPKIKVIWNTEIVSMHGENKLESIKLKENSGREYEFLIDGVFVAIGHAPATKNFADTLTLDELGYLKRNGMPGYEMSTNIEGIFTAGDVHDRHYRQAVTAAGFGAMAALDTLKFLDKDIPTW